VKKKLHLIFGREITAALMQAEIESPVAENRSQR